MEKTPDVYRNKLYKCNNKLKESLQSHLSPVDIME